MPNKMQTQRFGAIIWIVFLGGAPTTEPSGTICLTRGARFPVLEATLLL